MTRLDVGVSVYGDLTLPELPVALNALHMLFMPEAAMIFRPHEVYLPVGAKGAIDFNEPLDQDKAGVVGRTTASDGTEYLHLPAGHLGPQVECMLADTLHVTIVRNADSGAYPSFRMTVVFMVRSVSINKVAYAFLDLGSPAVISNASHQAVTKLQQH